MVNTARGNNCCHFVARCATITMKPALMLTIKMGNDAAVLGPLGVVINGIKAQPKDAAFLGASLRQHLGIQQ